jgi:hypothetical protein
MSWRFVKAKFKVGETVRFPYGRKMGRVKSVGLQVMEPEGRVLGLLYRVTRYELTEAQLCKYRPRGSKLDGWGEMRRP